MLNRIQTILREGEPFKAPMGFFLALSGIQLLMYMDMYFLLRGFLSGASVLLTGCRLVFLVLLTGGYFFFNNQFVGLAYRNGYTMAADLRLRLCAHLKKLPLSFFKTHDTGEISGALTEDMKNAEAISSVYLYDLIASIVFPFLFSIVLFFFDWRLTLILLGSVLCAMPLIVLACGIVSRNAEELLAARDRAFSTLMEYVGGIYELKAADMAGEKYTPLTRDWMRFLRLSIRLEGGYGCLTLAYTSALDVGFLLTLGAGAYWTDEGVAAAGVFLFFLIAGCRFYEPMQELGATIPELRYCNGSLRKIRAMLDTPPLPVRGGSLPRKTDVAFDHVSFAYGETQTLRDISFEIPEGGIVALVAPSGSGKTTIANLLLRFWDVDEGRVTVGGADIRSLEPENLYALFSVVFQDVYLFDDTIGNNIRLGKPDATDEEVAEAARRACCHDFITSLERGYQTRVGEGGAKLSGGEKQRVSIARAILKNAPIVILDEATSSLDPENELFIQQGLNSLLEGRTLLVIAHRLETIRYAETILVLEHGAIVERGRHEDLLCRKGRYASLWNSQQQMKSWQIASGERSSGCGETIA